MLQTGVPAALETQLRWWIERAEHRVSRGDRIVLRCNLEHPSTCAEHNTNQDETAGERDSGADHLAYCTPKEALLDIADAWLDLTPLDSYDPSPLLSALARSQPRHTLRVDLQQLLDDARSAYTLRSDRRGLWHRMDPAMEALTHAAVRNAEQYTDRGSAGEHLRKAVQTAYALHPDPVRAYSESIKAVEAAAHVILEPRNSKATLGTMIRVFRDATPEKLILDMGAQPGPSELESVSGMMHLLWSGQTSRHGGSHPTRDETVQEARAATHLASTLVQIFISGIIHRP
jgi:hypothetical protein